MPEQLIIFGVDPGVHGGIARLTVEGGEVRQVDCVDIPTTIVRRGNKNRTEFDCPKIAQAFEVDVPAVAVIEQTWPRPTDASYVVETLTACRWLFAGVWAALGIDSLVVSPQAWQTRLLTRLAPRVKTPGRDDRYDRRKQIKAAAVRWVLNQYGDGVPLIPNGCRVPADGRADAVCIAHYGGCRLGLIGE